MRAALATAVLTASGALALAAPAAAAPPVPPAPSDRPLVQGSADEFQYDDYGSELHSLGKNYVYLTTYSPDLDDIVDFYYGTQHSHFYINVGCDTQGLTILERVSRRAFLARVDSTQEHDVTVVYDRHNHATFTVRTFLGTDADGESTVCPS